MKKLIMAGMLMGITGMAHATWYEKNPDHCMSIGVNLDGAAGSGTAKVSSGGLSAEQTTTSGLFGLNLDTRIPLSDALSLNAGIGFAGSSMTADETALLEKQDISEGIVRFNVGLRFYIH